jgi:hypothetical protein
MASPLKSQFLATKEIKKRTKKKEIIKKNLDDNNF